MIRRFSALLLLASVPALADGPKDNLADNVRPVPPPGIEVPAETRTKIADQIRTVTA